MKYGTLVGISSVAEAEKRFLDVIENGMTSCQLIYSTEKYEVEDAIKLKEIAESCGIEISALFVGFGCDKYHFEVWDTQLDFINAGINSPLFARERVEHVCSAIPFMRALGVTDMVIHAGFVPNDPYESAYARMVGASSVIARALRAAGGNLLFETGTASPISLLRVINDIGTGNVFVNLDTGNLIIYGFGNPVDALTTFGKYVRNTHFKDATPPTIPGRFGPEVPIGQGNVDFPKVVKLLKELNYDRFITFEREISGPQQKADILAAKKYIEELWNGEQ